MSQFEAESWGRMLTVTTPEHVELRYETAGIGSRTGAQLIDLLVLLFGNAAVIFSIFFIVDQLPKGALQDWAGDAGVAAVILLLSLINIGYFLIGEYVTGGRTIGKYVMGIRVIQDNGRPLSFLSAAIRNFLRIIDMLPALYFAGALFSFFHPHDKRLGDIAAGTVVVYELRSSKRAAKRTEKQHKKWKEKWSDAMPNLQLEPWMRERVTEEEWSLLSGFAERLPYMAPEHSERMARDIVELLVPKLGLEERWNETAEALRQPQQNTLPRRGETEQKRSLPIAWALALYGALRTDWEWQAGGSGSAEDVR